MRAHPFVVVGLVCGALVSGVAAENVVIGSNRFTGSRDCGGGTAVIDGNRAQLTLEGCRTVTVNGNENTVDAGAPETLTVMGNRNQVTWKVGPGGRRTKVVNLGTRNTVTQVGSDSAAATAPAATAAPAAPAVAAAPAQRSTASQPAAEAKPSSGHTKGAGAVVIAPGANVVLPGLSGLTVSADGEHRTYDCQGSAAFISGDDNDLVLQNCVDVYASGDRNRIRAEGVKSITTSGDRNRIQWTTVGSSRPRLVSTGHDNVVEPAP